MEELYATLLLNEGNKNISDRNLANLLETVGYDVSLYDTDDFLTFIEDDSKTLVKDDPFDK